MGATRIHGLLLAGIVGAALTTGCSDDNKTSKYPPAGNTPAPAASAMASEPAQTGGSASDVIAQAKDAIKAAKANNWIWRDTEKFLKKAEAALAKGDNDTAMKNAKKALSQAKLAVAQYKLEQSTNRGL